MSVGNSQHTHEHKRTHQHCIHTPSIYIRCAADSPSAWTQVAFRETLFSMHHTKLAAQRRAQRNATRQRPHYCTQKKPRSMYGPGRHTLAPPSNLSWVIAQEQPIVHDSKSDEPETWTSAADSTSLMQNSSACAESELSPDSAICTRTGTACCVATCDHRVKCHTNRVYHNLLSDDTSHAACPAIVSHTPAHPPTLFLAGL